MQIVFVCHANLIIIHYYRMLWIKNGLIGFQSSFFDAYLDSVKLPELSITHKTLNTNK